MKKLFASYLCKGRRTEEEREKVITTMEEEKVQIEELSENAILIQNACKERYTPHILFHEYCLCYL
jgi:hypothetical protein